ncbi:MAG: (2Fe-2S)-binding protein [Pseudomonadales bacterium]
MGTRFTLNGLAQSVDLDPATPLIYVLRNELLLHGAKLGCGLEQCGACVVLLEGTPVYACTATLGDVDGKHLETVEGLAAGDGSLHPLQRAFIELNAMQCGYCSAGILMRLKALLDANPQPTRDAVCAALDGHLCRCGAHPRILRALERAIAIRAVSPR